jgi:hypothetical protein
VSDSDKELGYLDDAAIFLDDLSNEEVSNSAEMQTAEGYKAYIQGKTQAAAVSSSD